MNGLSPSHRLVEKRNARKHTPRNEIKPPASVLPVRPGYRFIMPYAVRRPVSLMGCTNLR